MNRASWWFLAVLIMLGALGGKTFVMRRQQATALRVQRETLRLELVDQEAARAENARLRSLQISPGELEALRADHAALPRLRAELEALNKSTPDAAR